MANKKLAATIVIGGAIASSLNTAFDNVKGKVGQVGSALRAMENQQRLVTNAIRVFGQEGKNVDGLRARYVGLTTQVDRLRAAHERLQRIERAQKANLAKRGEYRGQMLETAGLALAAAAPIKIAADRETHAMGIAKQLQGARDDAGNLTQAFWTMRKSVVELGHEIPLATNDLLDMATAGLRMGVSSDEILGFTRNTAKLASALELPAEQVGDQFGKIKTIYKLSLADLASLGDTVNYLDDQNTVKGGELIDFLQRVGGSASLAKVSAKEMAAVGTTLISMGETADTAGTSVKALFTKLSAGEKGTKKARAAFAELGLSPGAVAKGMQINAIGTIQKVMAQLNKLPAEKRTGVITEIVGLEHVGQISKLATGTKELATALEQAKGAASKGSVDKEFRNTVGTTNSGLKLLLNRVQDIGDNIGTVLLPSVNAIAASLGKASTSLADFAQEHPLLTKVVVGTGVALVGLRVATLAGGYAFTFLKGGALQVAGALAGARGQMALSAASARVLGASSAVANGGLVGMATRAMPMVTRAAGIMRIAMLSTGVGAIIAGIAAGGLLIYKNWDLVKSFFEGFGTGVMSALEPVKATFKGLYDSLGPLKPIIDGIGTAVGVVWDWFTKLLEPITHSSDQLGKATTAGETFGKIVGGAINLALTPMQALIKGITWIGDNAGAILDKLGGAFRKAKDLVTFGGTENSTEGAGAIDPGALVTPKASSGPAVPGLPGTMKLPLIVGKPGEPGAAGKPGTPGEAGEAGAPAKVTVQNVAPKVGSAVVQVAVNQPKADAAKPSEPGKPGEPGLPGTTPALPKVPPMATARTASASSYTDNSQNTYRITQLPGQSTRELAEEVTRIQEEKRAARQRGAMHDGASQ